MNSFSIPIEDSINAQALEHENAMVDVYTKMKPDYFKLQSLLQAVLTTYYEDVKGVQDCSCCHKTRIIKRQFEDQEDDACNEGADAADAGAGGAGAVDAGAGVADASAQLSASAAVAGGGGEAPAAPWPALAPSLVGKAGALVAKKKTT
jgi:hypothetical protein